MIHAVNAKAFRSIPPFTLREEEARLCSHFKIDPARQLLNNIGGSVEATAVFADGELGVVWGYQCSSWITDTCRAWMFATAIAERYPYRLGAAIIRSLTMLSANFARVEVLANKENKKAVNILLRAKFTVEAVYDYNGISFLLMVLLRDAKEETIN